jgi:hypothetical protein
MSKIFSVVALKTNTGIRDFGLMGGIPQVEDIRSSKLYQELVEDCGDSDYIGAVVKSYRYGEGEPENATAEDLEWIESQPDFLDRKDVTLIQTSPYFIIDPDQGQRLSM